MSPVKHETQPRSDGFPRVSGDEPPPRVSGLTGVTFSPRERG